VKGGIFTILTGGAHRVQGPLYSFIAGNNELGLALIIIIPLMRYLQLQAKGFWIRRGLAVSMFLTGIAVIGTHSRGALVGMISMGIFLLLKSRNKFLMMIPIIAITGAVLLIMPQEWHDRMSTITAEEQDASVQGRFDAWKVAFNIAKDRVLGGGFETFQYGAYLRYSDYTTEKLTKTADAHSIYFEVMGEHGFIGLFMFMLLAWFTWNTGSRIRRQAEGSAETRWGSDLANMLQVSMVGYAAAGAFLGLAYFDLYYDLIAMMVICRIVVQDEISGKEGMLDSQEAGLTVAAEQPNSSNRSY
jgi:probable O-glycosylation ligase (exosortase A-associated)